MKEFLVYKIYMILFELLRGLIIIILACFVFISLSAILASTINIIIAFLVVVIAGVSSQIYMGKIKGKIGEYVTQKIVEPYCNKKGYSYLYDVVINNDNEKSSQIDHLIITRRGIAVINTEFNTGTIFGSEYDKNWTNIIKKRKNIIQENPYDNPLSENYEHIEVLKKIIDKDVEYYNIAVFMDKVDFKECEVVNKFTTVGFAYDLNTIIEKLDLSSEKKISSTEAYEIYNKIKKVNVTDNELK